MRVKRKIIRMLVEVSVPGEMTVRQARREVRTLVNEQCNYSADYGDVKVKRVGPAPPKNREPAA